MVIMKFQNEHDEYLWEGSVVSGVVTGEGTSDGPVGWFAGVTLQPDLPEAPEEWAALKHYGTPYLILHESNEGFVTVLSFEKEVDRNERLQMLRNAESLGLADIRDTDAAEAITAYRKTIEWIAGHDGQNLSWSESAHRSTRDVVVEFITVKVDDLRTYMVTTSRGWADVGHDLAMAQQAGEGFHTYAGGPVVDDLMAAAAAVPDVTVSVNEQGEMEVAL